MNELLNNLQRLTEIAENPKKQLAHYLSQQKKVIGCFPVYTPEELVYAAGMIPMGLWGGPAEPYLAKSYVPAFCCPIMQSALELGLQGSYKGLSAVLIPTLCDTLRCITQNWKSGVADIPMIAVSYPQNRTDAGLRFLQAEYGTIKQSLEAISGQDVTDEKLAAAIDIYNAHNGTMRRFAKEANNHLDMITPRVRHNVMKSGHFMDKAVHTAIVRDITEALANRSIFSWAGKRILLTGIVAEPSELLDIMEENQLAVVADDLAQEMRQHRTDIPKGKVPLQRLTLQWKDRICSLAHDTDKSRIPLIARQVRDNQADGVICCMMKFCDPEEYDFPLIQDEMEKMGIPILHLEIDQQTGGLEQAKTRIQAFGDML